MQVVTNVPSDLIVALNGLVVVFVVSIEYLRRRARIADAAARPRRRSRSRRRRRRRSRSWRGGTHVNQFFTSAILTATVASGIQLAAPFLLAALGETIGQRSGVLNLGVDGIMLLGAFGGYYTALQTESLPLAVLVGIGIGALLGLVTAVVSVTLQGRAGDQRHRRLPVRARPQRPALPEARRDAAADQPAAAGRRSRCSTGSRPSAGCSSSRTCSSTSPSCSCPSWRFVLNRTTYGLNVQAVGENPAAADSLGVSVTRIRYSTVIIGSTLAGLAGATLLIETGIFQQNLTQSAGFIAVALVYFGAWRPFGVMAGALLYGLTAAVILSWKGLGIIPLSVSDLAATAPAVITVLALLTVARRFRQPAALGKPYERGA